MIDPWCGSPPARPSRGSAANRPLSPLAGRLGDESKVVQRASAEALRLIGNRLNANRRPGETAEQKQFVATLTAALRSPDDRVRRGATRIFAAHFRELSQELDLADALLQHLDDPDPVVATQAIKGLWRWWYWRDDLSLRNRIEDGLIASLDRPVHPWVRRNLIEALYIIGDENIRYLYNNWVPALASEESRDRADGRAARDGQPARRQVCRGPHAGERLATRGDPPRDLGVPRATRRERADRQRHRADVVLRRRLAPRLGGLDRPDVRRRSDDPTPGAPGPHLAQGFPRPGVGPRGRESSRRSRSRRPRMGGDDGRGLSPGGQTRQGRPGAPGGHRRAARQSPRRVEDDRAGAPRSPRAESKRPNSTAPRRSAIP